MKNEKSKERLSRRRVLAGMVAAWFGYLFGRKTAAGAVRPPVRPWAESRSRSAGAVRMYSYDGRSVPESSETRGAAVMECVYENKRNEE